MMRNKLRGVFVALYWLSALCGLVVLIISVVLQIRGRENEVGGFLFLTVTASLVASTIRRVAREFKLDLMFHRRKQIASQNDQDATASSAGRGGASHTADEPGQRRGDDA